ncbi:MAG TPA: tetratricopeptide repeat protein [Flavobacteriales bacterium]|nr:tetratricopeptide repeat protein [Flavobacteriales bacterium]HMZ48522.1 tetratricopeptide repeat protein [Flavobacteriales bacterium]HNE80020.1 tetratricopeptide repeat protein [Flavobacteriales bacterium]HNK68301.1 tetratricopeptide repeat protein [Flavobacteriales bacterium]HNM70364.1 tetratricopeptide repeat protein [Flavobacteriales bacterium]
MATPAERKQERMERARKFIALRLWPILVALGSALVMLLAFLIPSMQDQWDRYQARRVIGQYEEMGDRFMGEDNYRMAEEAYAKAVELSEGRRLDVESKRLEARVFQMTTMTNWGDSVPGDLEEVDFQFLLHMGPKDDSMRAMVLNAYGIFLASQQRPAEAEAAYQEAVTLDAKNPLIRINQGNLMDQMGRMQDAASAYRAAMRLDPGSVEAHYDLALLLLAQDSTVGAQKELMVASVLAPQDTAIIQRLRELRADSSVVTGRGS